MNGNRMTSEELRLAIEREQTAIDSIKEQLAIARRTAYIDKVFADREWFLSAERARRVKAKNITRFQVELSAVLKEERKEHEEAMREKAQAEKIARISLSNERDRIVTPVFHQLVKQELGEELYAELWASARIISGQQELVGRLI